MLTEPEAAKFLRIGLTKLREVRRSELIPHIPGKPVRYMSASLLNWMKEQEVPAMKLDSKPAPKRSTTYKAKTDKAALRAVILG
ncbi:MULTISPECIES: helix-turn-helix domain-containing protein [Alphaproteobacteria]|uniref:helix-turn-helix domain-containing protein n=1 Tax=Alphaproteobacteria TaxID=28211 RepID=UPI00329A568E